MSVQKFEKIMRGIQGALIVASTLQIVVGFSGLWRNVARFVNALPCYSTPKFLSSYAVDNGITEKCFSQLLLLHGCLVFTCSVQI